MPCSPRIRNSAKNAATCCRRAPQTRRCSSPRPAADAFLEYVVTDERTYLFVITKGGRIRVLMIPAGTPRAEERGDAVPGLRALHMP